MLAEPVPCHSFQLRTDKDATDQDQLATVSKDTLKMDIAAFNAKTDM
jgi:hypothetical protein